MMPLTKFLSISGLFWYNQVSILIDSTKHTYPNAPVISFGQDGLVSCLVRSSKQLFYFEILSLWGSHTSFSLSDRNNVPVPFVRNIFPIYNLLCFRYLQLWHSPVSWLSNAFWWPECFRAHWFRPPLYISCACHRDLHLRSSLLSHNSCSFSLL